MLPLLIRLVHTETGVEREAGFRRSPVRIGRNHLNDLTLDEAFVSQWHGIVRFEEDETRYIDVGSKNGTVYKGERLESKEEVVLADEAELEIGPIKLTVVRTALREDQVVSRRASSFRLGGAAGPASDGKAATMMLPTFQNKGGVVTPVLVPGGKAAPEPVGMPSVGKAKSKAEELGESGENREAKAKAKALRASLDRLKPLHDAYEKARNELDSAIDAAVREARAGKDADAIVAELRRQAPLAFEIPGVRDRSGLPPESEEVDVAAWLERLVPVGKTAQWGNPSDAMERAGALLEAFAMGLVELRAAQREVMTRLGVSPSAEGSSLHRIEDPRELVSYLLDPRSKGDNQVDEVSRMFADFALHQIAVVNGAIEGARAVLWELSPHQLGAAEKGALARTSASFGDWVWPFKTIGHYYRFATKHAELGSGDRFTTFLFGSAFSRAYGRVTGGQGPRSSAPQLPRST